MTIFYSQHILKDTIELDEEESRHCNKVLRKKEGDFIDVIDGKGYIYKSKIITTSKNHVTCAIVRQELYPKFHADQQIAIAPTKNADRIEWFVEKAVEIGIGTIHFIETARTERIRLNIDRLNKIVISAMKQSKNIYQPTIVPLTQLDDFLLKPVSGNKFIAHLNEESVYLPTIGQIAQNSLLLIGPEGDFTPEEVDKCIKVGYKEVSLGQSVLRTETAGIFGLVTLNIISKKPSI
jgi:16S rRNA (uracil1498-N3)-methyltransferase